VSDDPLHQDDPDHRRAIKAMLIFEEYSPGSTLRLTDNKYRKLEAALRSAFRRITREETQEQARRRDRTARDGG
jgi:hypothetical protein